MELLTEKAKDLFNDWIYNKYGVLYNLEDYHETMIYAEIIEFLDSFEIYVSIFSQLNDNGERRFTSDVNDNYFTSCEKRNVAVVEAIKTANKIFNEKQD